MKCIIALLSFDILLLVTASDFHSIGTVSPVSSGNIVVRDHSSPSEKNNIQRHSSSDIPPKSKRESNGIIPPSPGLSFQGATGGSQPPDTNGAVGPNHIVTVVHYVVTFHDKLGNTISSINFNTFWNSLSPSNPFDPRMIYDHLGGRFIFTVASNRRSQSSAMLLAVSKTNDPTGEWDMWRYEGDPNGIDWVDFPNLGVNKHWIVVTTRMFSIAGDHAAGSHNWLINKTEAYSEFSSPNSTMFNSGSNDMCPVVSYTLEDNTFLCRVALSYSANGLGYLYIFSVDPSGHLNRLASLPNSSSWSYAPPEAPQRDTSNLIDSNDDKLLNGVLVDNRLWLTQMIGLPQSSPSISAVKWWEINVDEMSGGYGMTVQSGNIGGTDMFYYFPSISVNLNREVLVGFSGSNTTTYVSTYYAFRDDSMPLGTTSEVGMMKEGTGPYSRSRWGDYSATCMDPEDSHTLWTIQEHATQTSTNWGVWWASFGSDQAPPTSPVPSTSQPPSKQTNSQQTSQLQQSTLSQMKSTTFEPFSNTDSSKSILPSSLSSSSGSKSNQISVAPIATTFWILPLLIT